MPLVNTSRDLAIVAHQDDDLLFMNPDIQASIDAGNEVTTLYITAGDAGEGEAYWSGREQGVKNAYAAMAGGGAWIDEVASLTFNGTTYNIHTSSLASAPEVRLYFLRMPDGGENGLPRYNFESLTQLDDGRISTITSVDGAATYTKSGVLGAIGAVLDHHQPDQIRVQDHESEHAPAEHRDHLATAHFTEDALAAYEASQYTVTGYVHYGSADLRANLNSAEQAQTLATFQTYAEHDSYVFVGDGALHPLYLDWSQRQYISSEVTVTPSGSNSVTGQYAHETTGAGIAGANVYLFDANSEQIIAEAHTALDGSYQFHGIPTGSAYRIFFQDPTTLGGDFLSFGFSSENNHDVVQILPNGAGATDVFSIASGQNLTDVDATIYNANPSTISGVYFQDTDANGQQSANEAGIADAIVTLYDSDTQTIIDTTHTNASGAYRFDPVVPNATYDIAFEGPETLGAGFANHMVVLGNGPVTGIDPAGAALITGIDTPLGTTHTEMNAGLFVSSIPTITGRVFGDSNVNGLNDPSEAGISGVTVALRSGGETIATTTSNLAGDYTFTNMTPDQSYTVRFDPRGSNDPAYLAHNYGFSAPNQNTDDRIDSDVIGNPFSGAGRTASFTIGEGQTISHIDAGLVPPEAASISGRYFVDHNNNGLDDGGQGLSNGTITLFQGDTEIAVANTNSRGEFFFEGITHGDDFFVMFENPDFVADTQTNGFTTQNTGLTPLFGISSHVSDLILYGNGRTDSFSLEAGQNLDGLGAGVANFIVPWAEDGMLGG